MADRRHQDALRTILNPIREAGALADGISLDDAVEIVFFHFRYPQFVLAVDGFGWGRDRALGWLVAQVTSAILRPGTRA